MQACIQKISLSLKNFAHSVTELVDSVDEAQHMFPASAQMDKVQGILVQILSNCSNLGTFKDTAGPSQGQGGNDNGGPLSEDDGLFVSDPSFWDACVELAKTYEKTGGNAHPGSFTPPTFDLGFGFGLSQSRQTANPKQVGSPLPSSNGAESESGSGPHTPIESSPVLEPESTPIESSPVLEPESIGEAAEHSTEVQLQQRKKMRTALFRSPFFVRHIDVLKSLTVKEKQVSNWAFLPLDDVHYER